MEILIFIIFTLSIMGCCCDVQDIHVNVMDADFLHTDILFKSAASLLIILF